MNPQMSMEWSPELIELIKTAMGKDPTETRIEWLPWVKPRRALIDRYGLLAITDPEAGRRLRKGLEKLSGEAYTGTEEWARSTRDLIEAEGFLALTDPEIRKRFMLALNTAPAECFDGEETVGRMMKEMGDRFRAEKHRAQAEKGQS